MMIVIL